MALATVVVLSGLGPAAPTSAAPARAGDPPRALPAGTVVLADGPTGVPRAAGVEAVTPSALVYRTAAGLFLRRFDSGAVTRLAGPDASIVSSSGEMLLFSVDDGQRWFDVATARGGPTARRFQAVDRTGGGLSLVPSSVVPRSIELRRQDLRTGAVTALSSTPYDGDPADLNMVSGPDGVVLSSHSHDAAAVFARYQPFGGVARELAVRTLPGGIPLGLFCTAVSSTQVVCTTADGSIVLLPLSGTRGRVRAVPTSHGLPSLTDQAAAWPVEGQRPDGSRGYRLQTVPIAGGAIATSTFTMLAPPLATPTVVGGGGRFSLSTGTSPADAGIATVTDATSTPQVVVALGAAPYAATDLAVGGNRVAWTDNRTPGEPMWARTVTSEGGATTVGQRARIAGGAAGVGLGLSGSRTGYISVDAETGHQNVANVLSPWQPSWHVTFGASPRLSGTRLAYTEPDIEPWRTRVVDLVAHTSVTTDSFGDDWNRGALWGDTYTFTDGNGAVLRKDLARADPAVPLRAAGYATDNGSSPLVWDHWLVVQREGPEPTSGPVSWVVDTRSGAERPLDRQIVQVTEAGYVHRDYQDETFTLTAWTGSASVTVEAGSLDASATVMAWIGTDGRPRAAPVPWRTSERPRAFGTVTAAPVASRSGAPWVLDVPASTALTSCTVDLLQSATVVRSLPCRPADAALGDAVVIWDLADATGTPVASGSYSWRVRAANRCGSLTGADGDERPLTGRVRVTA